MTSEPGYLPQKSPFRLKLAQLLCRRLPPIIAGRVRDAIYPQNLAFNDNHRFQTTAQTGALFEGTTCDVHSYPFAVHGYYEWRNWAVTLAVNSVGDNILEVGANVGTETVGFRDIVGEKGCVHAIEPLPSNVEALERIIEMNRWNNVIIHPFALGADNRETSFVLPLEKWSTGTGHIQGEAEFSHGKTITVKVVRLDDIVEDLGVINAIIMDTEGAEVDILQGAKETISKFQPVIILEAAPAHLDRYKHSIKELQDVLAELEYTPLEITRFGVTEPLKWKKGKNANWVCLPKDKQRLIQRIRAQIFWCSLLPCVAGVNPITRRREPR